jgi:hypothetical protein
MKHAISYHGPFECNFARRLRPGFDSYETRAGELRPIPDWPTAVDGVRFGYMEKEGKTFFAVRAAFGADDVILKAPIELDPQRHTDDKGFAPPPTTFGDGSARRLLDDMAAANADQSEALKRIKAAIPS